MRAAPHKLRGRWRRAGAVAGVMLAAALGPAAHADRGDRIDRNAAPLGLELPRIDGTAFVKLDDFAGRPVLINFWGSECPPCVAEMPRLFAASGRHPGLQFLGVAIDQRNAAQRFLSQRDPTYPQLIATTQPEVLLRRFGNPAGALPYTVVVDPQHRVCATRLGEVDDAWIDAAVQACGAAGR